MTTTPNMAAPSVLECPICNDQYGTEHDTTPRVLGCGHTYCSKCLTQLVTVRGAKSKVKCAFCNFQHALLRPDPTLIPANHAVIEIIKLGDVVPDDGPKCEYKGSKCTGSASWVCFDCNAGEQTLFCEKCIKTEHERQFGPVRRHRRTPMAQLNEPQTVTCHWHSKNRATLYSLKLRKFACNDCNSRADFAEQRALFEPIGPVTRQLRAQAKRLVLYSQDVLARLNAMLQSIAADKAQLSPSVQQAKTQIQEKFAAITNIVQERQQVLMDRIETEFAQRKLRMEEQLTRTKKAFTELNSAQSSLNSTLGKHDTDFLLHYELVFNAMETVLSEEDRSLQRIVSYRDIPFFIPQNIMTELSSLGAVGGGAVPYDLTCESSNTNANLMKLQWQIPHGASEVLRYEIEYEYLPNPSETGLRGSKVQTGTYYNTEPQSVIIAGNVLTSYVDNLVPGCRYRFRIRSQNAAGWGIWSDSVVALCEPFPLTIGNTKRVHNIRIPCDGYYKITAKGAKAADGRLHYGGRGAVVSGTFYLCAGQVLIGLVGSQSGMSVCNTGGGGGTFVTLSPLDTPVSLSDIDQDALLLAAGGGGGTRGLEDKDEDGCDASLETWGTNGRGQEHGKGGMDGGPGEDANSESFNGPCWGYGGAGWMQDSSSARSFVNGGQGGQYGGFGGGGAVGLYGGGGGGGYSGGGGGRGGGGGGSYVKDTAINVSKKVGNDGHGCLVIKVVPPPSKDTYVHPPHPGSNATQQDTVQPEGRILQSPSDNQLQSQSQPTVPAQPTHHPHIQPPTHNLLEPQLSQISTGSSQSSSSSVPHDYRQSSYESSKASRSFFEAPSEDSLPPVEELQLMEEHMQVQGQPLPLQALQGTGQLPASTDPNCRQDREKDSSAVVNTGITTNFCAPVHNPST